MSARVKMSISCVRPALLAIRYTIDLPKAVGFLNPRTPLRMTLRDHLSHHFDQCGALMRQIVKEVLWFTTNGSVKRKAAG